MKIPTLLSFAAMIAVVAAQSEDVTVAPTTVVEAGPIALDNAANDNPAHALADDDDPGRGGSSQSGFIAWSSPGFKGHKQRTRNASGCYRLDGGAVGSFQGDATHTYAFYSDSSCRQRMVFGPSNAPVSRISPIIFPSSVRIVDKPMPMVTLVTWTRPVFRGDRQIVRGFGCQPLDGSIISSFQGNNRYTFYRGRGCMGRSVFESRGGRSSIPSIRAGSVFIRN